MQFKNLVSDSLQCVLDTCFSLLLMPNPSAKALSQVKIVAHRGAHHRGKFMENTRPAFDQAILEGLWGMEFDIRWTRDLVPVIHHDPDCLRLFGKRLLLAETEFKILRGEVPQIPTLQEMVEYYGKKIHFFIELKLEHFPALEKQKEILAGILSPLQPVQDYHFLTLAPQCYDSFNRFDPNAYVLVGDFNVNSLSNLVLERGWGGMTGHYFLVKDQHVLNHHRKNQMIGTGFPASMNCLRREINRGMDWIFTNDSHLLLQYLEKMKKESSTL